MWSDRCVHTVIRLKLVEMSAAKAAMAAAAAALAIVEHNSDNEESRVVERKERKKPTNEERSVRLRRRVPRKKRRTESLSAQAEFEMVPDDAPTQAMAVEPETLSTFPVVIENAVSGALSVVRPPRAVCPFPECGRELESLTDEEVQRHVCEHNPNFFPGGSDGEIVRTLFSRIRSFMLQHQEDDDEQQGAQQLRPKAIKAVNGKVARGFGNGVDNQVSVSSGSAFAGVGANTSASFT